VRVTILLADHAQVANDKLYLLGGGWAFTGPQVAGPMGLAVLIEVPWDQANRPHKLKLELQDADGQLPLVPPANQPLVVEGDLEVGRPPGHPEGTPLNVPFALNVPGLALPPGARYVWVLYIDGDTSPEWQVAFNVRPLQ